MDVTTLPELAPVFDNLAGAREFLKTDMALYAGGGAAGFGLLLIVIGAVTGGKKKVRSAVKPPSLATETIAPRRAKPERKPVAPAAAKPVDVPLMPPVQMPPPAAAPRPAPRIEPAPALAPAPEAPKAKPQASGQPPASAAQPATPAASMPDPRMINRKRVQDLVTINDALTAYYAKNGSYPTAEGLAGANERGAAWIPGLSPDFLTQLPLDPLHSAGTQYVYAAQGANYKLLAQGVSLVGSSKVEVLGIRIDPTRNPTPQNAAFGFWTPAFAGV
jgi:hypothetical protein